MAAKDIPEPLFDTQINVKMSQELRAGLRRIEAKHGTPIPEILRRLGAAAATFFDKNGYLTFPVSITPETFSPPVGTNSSRKKAAKSTRQA
jgi:hypothetical protein